MDRHLQGRDGSWTSGVVVVPQNTLLVYDWAVQEPIRYSNTRIVPDSENPQFSTWPPPELLGNITFVNWSTLSCYPTHHSCILRALPKSLETCGFFNTMSVPMCKMTFRRCSKPTGCDTTLFSATKMVAWLILNYLLFTSVCIQLISQVFANQRQKFLNCLAILWTRSTSLSFSLKSRELGLLIGLYEN